MLITSEQCLWKPWFGEYQLLQEPATRLRALTGPVVLACNYAGMGATRDKVVDSFKEAYYEIRGEHDPLTRPGQFRLHPNPDLIEVWLKLNVYHFSFIGLLQPRDEDPIPGRPSNVLVLFAVGGKSGREGLTLSQAVDVLLTQVTFEVKDRVYTVADALLIDQGLDVFQFADGSFRLPIEGQKSLPKEKKDPRKSQGRDRIRAVFIIGEKHQRRRAERPTSALSK